METNESNCTYIISQKGDSKKKKKEWKVKEKEKEGIPVN